MTRQATVERPSSPLLFTSKPGPVGLTAAGLGIFPPHIPRSASRGPVTKSDASGTLLTGDHDAGDNTPVRSSPTDAPYNLTFPIRRERSVRHLLLGIADVERSGRRPPSSAGQPLPGSGLPKPDLTLTMIVSIPTEHLPRREPGPYASDRRCRHALCITRLHRNNPGPYCEAHRQEIVRDNGEDLPDSAA